MPEENAKGQDAKAVVPKKKKQTLLMLGALLFVMAAEGGGIYFAVKFLGNGPAEASAEGLAPTSHGGEAEGEGEGGGHGAAAGHGAEAGLAVRDAELPVASFKAPNLKSGRLYLYQMEVYAKTKQEKSAALKSLLEANKATIEDRLNRVIRSAEPQDLQEDGLETVRRQIRHELNQIVGDDKMIDEVLIPKCTPYKVDY